MPATGASSSPTATNNQPAIGQTSFAQPLHHQPKTIYTMAPNGGGKQVRKLPTSRTKTNGKQQRRDKNRRDVQVPKPREAEPKGDEEEESPAGAALEEQLSLLEATVEAAVEDSVTSMDEVQTIIACVVKEKFEEWKKEQDQREPMAKAMVAGGQAAGCIQPPVDPSKQPRDFRDVIAYIESNAQKIEAFTEDRIHGEGIRYLVPVKQSAQGDQAAVMRQLVKKHGMTVMFYALDMKNSKLEQNWGLPTTLEIMGKKLSNLNRPQTDRCRAIVKAKGKRPS